MPGNILQSLAAAFPAADRMVLMKDGKAYPAAEGFLLPQLKEAGLKEEDVRAVVAREYVGLTVPHIAQHDLYKPLFILSAGSIIALGRKQIDRLRASIKYAHG